MTQGTISPDHARARIWLIGLFLDVAAMFVAFAGANLLLLGKLVQNGKPHGLVLFAMIAPPYALFLAGAGGYGIRSLAKLRKSLPSAVWAMIKAAALTLLIIYLGKIGDRVSRLTFVVGLGLSSIGLALIRLLLKRTAQRMLDRLPRLTCLLTDGVSVPWASRPVMEAAALNIDPTRHDAAMAGRLATAVGTAERVVIACPPERMADWSTALRSLSARGEILLPELARFAPATLGAYDGHPTLLVAGGPMMFRDRIIKRLFDLVVAGLGTLLLSPVLLAAAIAIKLSGPGPVLFRQQRLGRDARPFFILKFRTMRADASDHAADRLTDRDDPRVTRVGAFLRRTSIDELPQLLNVLTGDMSIVGPRPHAAGARAADKLYWEVDSRYWARHCIKPGITGLAQVRGHRGATHRHQDLVDRLQSDLEYVTHWSIWRDIRIVAATAAVLFHPNAY